MESSWCGKSQIGKILNHDLLRTEISEEEALALQTKWKILHRNSGKGKLDIFDLPNLRYIAGVDISFPPDKNPTWGIACATLWDLHDEKMLETTFQQETLPFPYIPGFLGFRECYPIAQAVLKLHTKPQVIICDGHGLIHPLRFGEAIQLGIALNIPTFGAAKTPFIGESNWKSLPRFKGEKTPVMHKETQALLGYAVCGANDRKPIFISEGYGVDIELALHLAINTTSSHRQPDPVFQADQLSREQIRSILKSQSIEP